MIMKEEASKRLIMKINARVSFAFLYGYGAPLQSAGAPYSSEILA